MNLSQTLLSMIVAKESFLDWYYKKFAILFNVFLGENVVFYHRENILNIFGCRSDVMLRIPISTYDNYSLLVPVI